MSIHIEYEHDAISNNEILYGAVAVCHCIMQLYSVKPSRKIFPIVSVCGSTCQVLECMLVLYSISVKHCWIFKCLLVYWDLQFKSTNILT